MKDSNSRLVYSTDQGRIKSAPEKPSTPSGDGVVRIRRETKGRKGKGVTCIEGIQLDDKPLKALAKELKQLCGTGGSLKAGVVEIQGDQREKIKAYLEQKGHKVKLSGG